MNSATIFLLETLYNFSFLQNNVLAVLPLNAKLAAVGMTQCLIYVYHCHAARCVGPVI